MGREILETKETKMRAIREMLSKFASAMAAQRKLSNYLCQGCDLRDHCSLPPWRRQLCAETRALRPR